jgi:[ribosomal protein S5]-alanine N-acetyltransferase
VRKDSLGPFPSLSTARFVLRGLTVDDAADLYPIHADEEVMRHFGAAPKESVAEAVTWIQGYREEEEAFRWGIVPRESLTADAPRGHIVGTCGFHAWDLGHHRIDVGYELARDWRQGVMSEVLPAAIRAAFIVLPVNRVQALVEPENVASRRLLEKLGFREEGLLREYERAFGRYFDLLMFAVLRSEVMAGE